MAQEFDNRNGTEDRYVISHSSGPILHISIVKVGQMFTTGQGSLNTFIPIKEGWEDRCAFINELWLNIGSSDIPQPSHAFYNSNKNHFEDYMSEDNMDPDILFIAAGEAWVQEHITDSPKNPHNWILGEDAEVSMEIEGK